MLACFYEVFCVSCTGVDVRFECRCEMWDLTAPSACESHRLVDHCSLKAMLVMPPSGPKKGRGKTRQLAKSSLKQLSRVKAPQWQINCTDKSGLYTQRKWTWWWGAAASHTANLETPEQSAFISQHLINLPAFIPQKCIKLKQQPKVKRSQKENKNLRFQSDFLMGSFTAGTFD